MMLTQDFSTGVAIADDDITLVFQGAWHPSLESNIVQSRTMFPGAKVIVSTLDSDPVLRPLGVDVDCVVSADPGALPPYKRDKRAPVNNVNRQIATSRAGLARVTTRYAIKIRTDCVLSSRACVEKYGHIASHPQARDRLLASSIYTLHPDGIEAFPFHLSDWFFFGPTELLRAYYDAPFMSDEDATWFEVGSEHARGSSYFARRYVARYTPEQYLAVDFAKRSGCYSTPSFINDSNAQIDAAYRRFLADQCIVCDPDELGLRFDKYAHAARSNYQFFNCLWGSDWRELCEQSGHTSPAFRLAVSSPSSHAPRGLSTVRHGQRAARRRAVVQTMRRLDFIFPLLRTTGLMPLVGDLLGFYRKL
ncbi:hypothetical protein GNZ12_42015 [Paraburkholderia sp. 1N]|uniref:WavE lipopolysaccharide synthesis n=1 Tax=Paraburkholderia solitsugae TaxID=2675748 RepID=A0ABX2C5Q9_9BURK|nr:WavE lipopolysaccharide synthesis family protein [Paraburkholderia solitsugae]NPT47761.1 hypothetical protein [Paraburkholderia solitsugae]